MTGPLERASGPNPLNSPKMADGLGSWMMLTAQAALAAITVDQLRRRVFGSQRTATQSVIVVDVWGPVIVCLPMLGFVGQTQESVRGIGWMTVGAPVAAGVLALGAAIIVSFDRTATSIANRNGASSVPNWLGGLPIRSASAWTFAGIALVLLASAHHMSLWVGQCTFALAAALLWWNSPDDDELSDSQEPADREMNSGLMIALLAAVVHSVVVFKMPGEFVRISGGVVMLTAAMIIAAAARLAGPMACIGIGGWAATYGFLLGCGALSLEKLMPQAIRVVQLGEAAPVGRIAHGYGAYALEGLLLASLAGFWTIVHRLPQSVARIIGVVVLVFAAVLAAWRLSM